MQIYYEDPADGHFRKRKLPCKNVQRDHSLDFHRKDLCDAKHKMQSVFKFSDVLFALKSDGPPSRGI